MKKMIEAKQTLKWPKYRVNFYSGYYRVRQQDANDDGAVCFVAHHFNAVASAKPEYVLCNVGSNASSKSIAWARDYAKLVGQAFGYPLFNNDGICIGGMGGRGDSQLRYTRMPAILPEPLFCSNPEHAAILRSDHGRQALAEILVDSIRMHFPAAWSLFQSATWGIRQHRATAARSSMRSPMSRFFGKRTSPPTF